MTYSYKYPSKTSEFFVRLLIGYTIIQPAIFKLFVNFDGMGRMYVILSAISIFTIIQTKLFKKVFFTGPALIWGIWGVYVTLTTLYFGKPTALNNDKIPLFIFIFSRIFYSYIIMCFVCYDVTVSPRKAFRFLLICFAIYAFIGSVFQAPTVAGTRGGLELGNFLSLAAMCMVALAVMANIKQWISFKQMVLLCILAFMAIFMVATRKALAGCFIILVFYTVAKFNFKKAKDVVMILLIAVVAFIAISYIMENTLIGERMQSIETQHHRYNIGNNLFLKLVGDRSYFYILGTKLYLENDPFLGIGLLHFPQMAKSTLPIHSEYMVQLCECGIIGCLISLIFYLSILSRILKLRRINGQRSISITELGFFLCVLFIALTAWIYDIKCYFIVFGAILGYYNYTVSSLKNKTLETI